MNIDFSAHPGFSFYIILLAVSGALMVGMGTTALSGRRTGARILNTVLGVGFLGYAFYLAFIFHSGHYIVFFQVFIVPILMIARTIRTRTARNNIPAPAQTTQSGPL